MPQLDFSFYASQMLVYLGCFFALSFVVFGFVYARLEGVISQREKEIAGIAAETEAAVASAEKVRIEIGEYRRGLYSRIAAIRRDYRSRAASEFERIASLANSEFDKSIQAGSLVLSGELSALRARLSSFVGDLSREVVAKVNTESVAIGLYVGGTTSPSFAHTSGA